MTSFGTIPLKKIWSMLDECAPGHERVERTHNWTIYYKEKTYPSLPKGGHKKVKAELQVGHIRQMVRFLGIEDCAAQELKILQ